MNHIQGNNRNQIRMISLEEMVEPESMVRIIDAFVSKLDLASFGFSYLKLAQRLDSYNSEDYIRELIEEFDCDNIN